MPSDFITYGYRRRLTFASCQATSRHAVIRLRVHTTIRATRRVIIMSAAMEARDYAFADALLRYATFSRFIIRAIFATRYA